MAASILWSTSTGSPQESDILSNLKQKILREGLSEHHAGHRSSSTRALTWKLLLGIIDTPAHTYLDLVRLGPSSVNDKIRDDTYDPSNLSRMISFAEAL